MSAYSRLHESHIGNSAIAVLSLSYGNDDNNVNLAPQLVHVVNAYPLRLPSDLISLRHSSQTAVSVGMLTPLLLCSECTMENDVQSGIGASNISILSMIANGGRLLLMPSINASASSTSIITLEPSFHTLPLRPREEATRCTIGLKPTPWTVPSMMILISAPNPCSRMIEIVPETTLRSC